MKKIGNEIIGDPTVAAGGIEITTFVPFENSGVEKGSSKEGIDWLDFANKTNSVYGAAVTGADLARMGGVIRVGEKTITGLGAAGGVLGTGLDMYGVYNYYHPNAGNKDSRVSPTKFGIDGTATSIGIWGGPPGEICSTVYFGIDAFYPGGTFGFATNTGQALINSGSPIIYQP